MSFVGITLIIQSDTNIFAARTNSLTAMTIAIIGTVLLSCKKNTSSCDERHIN